MTIFSATTRRSATLAIGLGIATLGLSGAAQARDRSPASAGAPATDMAATTTEAAIAKPETRYCIVETPTGSHIQRKTCKTRGDWLKSGVDPLDAK